MRLSQWNRDEVAERLAGAGLFLHTGPFLNCIQTAIPTVADGIALLYPDYRVSDTPDFADFHVALAQPHGLRRWFRRQVRFEFDGVVPFKPLPFVQAMPMLEWGLNWCIGNHAHQFLIIHAAAIEKDGQAAILPGAPGSGKSTLTAFLIHHGWRLLSDELALLRLDDCRLTPLARPISLKNRSIDIIEEVIPGAVLSPRCPDTAKGTVALLKVPQESVKRTQETASPAWVIFPHYKQGEGAALEPRSKADTLIEVGHNAFNYSIHGKLGFELLARLVDGAACYDFTYGDLDSAREVFAALGPQLSAGREAMV